MSKEKINLEEILQDCYLTTLDKRDEIHAPIEEVKLAMLEFGKQLLELAAENATYDWNDHEDIIIDKQSILDTIKQVE